MKLQGEIQSVSDPEEYPFAPSPLPPVSGHDYSEKMMYVWMTDYVANSAAVVYQKAGLMSYTITDDMVCATVYVSVCLYVYDYAYYRAGASYSAGTAIIWPY